MVRDNGSDIRRSYISAVLRPPSAIVQISSNQLLPISTAVHPRCAFTLTAVSAQTIISIRERTLFAAHTGDLSHRSLSYLGNSHSRLQVRHSNDLPILSPGGFSSVFPGALRVRSVTFPALI